LPIPAGAVTSTARAVASSTHSANDAESVASSMSRPTHLVGLPASLRTSATGACSRWSNKMPALVSVTSKRPSSSPAVTSSMATHARRGAAEPVGCASPEVRSSSASICVAWSISAAAGSLPPTSARPVATAIERPSNRVRSASAQRAACAA
jgi:hypothetical protein